jgi:[acyl-carrier-protein] S-malonyltransferase
MNKTAFLFPGQGSQSVGMMADIAQHSGVVRETFDTASRVLGYDLWEVSQEGPAERLNQTATTQPALLTAGIATWRAWKDIGGFDPDYLAGHSLGEYTALVASGSIGFEDAVSLVAERGKLMQAAVPPGAGAMAAVIGLDDGILEGVCDTAAQGQIVSCANFNSPGQVVIAGDKEAVDRACALADEAGARRAIPLAVSVPSHCALMRPAADQLEQLMRDMEVRPGDIPVMQNVDVAVHSNGDEIRSALARQLWQPVRWSASVQSLIGLGVTHFAECGPGKVLAGLNRRISREVTTAPLADHAALAQTLVDWK